MKAFALMLIVWVIAIYAIVSVSEHRRQNAGLPVVKSSVAQGDISPRQHGAQPLPAYPAKSASDYSGGESLMDKVQIYRGRRGLFSRTQWRARVVDAGNNEKLFQSTEGYNNLGDLMRVTARLFPDLAIEVEGSDDA